MKRIISTLLALVFLTSNIPSTFAAGIKLKPDKASKSTSSEPLVVNGSLLNSSKNIIKTAKLSKDVLKAIKKAGGSISVLITKVIEEGESTDIYTLGSDGIELKGKKLILNLFSNLVNSSGAVVTAGSLPSGEYRISVVVGEDTFNVSQTFEYRAPVIFTGSVDDCGGGGTQQITDVTGSSLSNLVAVSSDCSYINEVTADNENASRLSRKFKHQEDAGTSSGDAGTSSGDAGTSSGDAGTSSGDAGTSSGDAGTSSGDAGTSSGDAGTSSGDAGTSSGDAGSSSGDVTGSNDQVENVIISEVITEDGETKKAADDLDEEDNGEETTVSDDSTDKVESAYDLATGGEGTEVFEDETITEEEKEEIAEAVEESLEEVVEEKDASEEGEEVSELPPPDVCSEALISLLEGVCGSNFENPESVTDETLLTCAEALLSKLTSESAVRKLNQEDTSSVDPLSCIPDFVFNKIIPNIQTDDDKIRFVKGFIGNATRRGNRGPNPEEVCKHLSEGLAGQSPQTGKGNGQGFLPPPCIPPGIREIVKNTCPELASKLPEKECAEAPRPCGDEGPTPDQTTCPEGTIQCPNGECVKDKSECGGGENPNPPEGCFENPGQIQSDLCKPCQSDSDCVNPVRVTTPDKCVLPKTICGEELDPFGNSTGNKVCILETLDSATISSEGGDLSKQASHNGGIVDPFTCKEYPFACGGAIAPPQGNECLPFIDGKLNTTFNIKCCFDANQIARTTKLQTKENFVDPLSCICQDGNFDPETGFINEEAINSIFECFGQGGGSGINIPKECQDPAFAEANPDKCKPTSGSQCTDGQFFCFDLGKCVSNPEDCGGGSGSQCPEETPVQCPDGRCVKDPFECKPTTGGQCPEGQFPCPDGKCVTDTTQCGGGSTGGICPEGHIQCPDGKCVTDPNQCVTDGGTGTQCPEGQFPCPDGKCVNETSQCGGSTAGSGCSEGQIKCPDGKCVSDPNQCVTGGETGTQCPEGTIKCPDGSCKSSTTECTVP